MRRRGLVRWGREGVEADGSTFLGQLIEGSLHAPPTALSKAPTDELPSLSPPTLGSSSSMHRSPSGRQVSRWGEVSRRSRCALRRSVPSESTLCTESEGLRRSSCEELRAKGRDFYDGYEDAERGNDAHTRDVSDTYYVHVLGMEVLSF